MHWKESCGSPLGCLFPAAGFRMSRINRNDGAAELDRSSPARTKEALMRDLIRHYGNGAFPITDITMMGRIFTIRGSAKVGQVYAVAFKYFFMQRTQAV